MSLSKIMGTLSQAAALCVVLTFLVGMQWQEAFYRELGFYWISGYANYLDIIKSGIPIVKILIFASATGYFTIWFISSWKPNLTPPILLLTGIVVIPFSELVSSWFTEGYDLEFIDFRSHYQLITIGLFLGGLLKEVRSNRQYKNPGETHNSAPQPTDAALALAILSIIMLAVSDAPTMLGKSSAQHAMRNGFQNYSTVTDNKAESWKIVGYSQGNLILARISYQRNHIQMKISNNLADWIISPTITPQSIIVPSNIE